MNSDPLPASSQLGVLLQKLGRRFAALNETGFLDAQTLLAASLGRPRAWLMTHPEHELTAEELRQIEDRARRYEDGEPLPYILGKWEFYGLSFEVGPGVLIPRPETELLVDEAARYLRTRSGAAQAADVGTGSGIIAVTLAHLFRDMHFTASDLSRAALEIAARNARTHGVHERIHFIQTDLLQGVADKFHLVCANLPYIPSAVLQQLPIYGREPSLALDGGPDGLDAIRNLLTDLPQHLLPGGLALLEIEENQGEMALGLCRQYFPAAQAHIKQDLAGRDRLLVLQVEPD